MPRTEYSKIHGKNLKDNYLNYPDM